MSALKELTLAFPERLYSIVQCGKFFSFLKKNIEFVIDNWRENIERVVAFQCEWHQKEKRMKSKYLIFQKSWKSVHGKPFLFWITRALRSDLIESVYMLAARFETETSEKTRTRTLEAREVSTPEMRTPEVRTNIQSPPFRLCSQTPSSALALKKTSAIWSPVPSNNQSEFRNTNTVEEIKKIENEKIEKIKKIEKSESVVRIGTDVLTPGQSTPTNSNNNHNNNRNDSTFVVMFPLTLPTLSENKKKERSLPVFPFSESKTRQLVEHRRRFGSGFLFTEKFPHFDYQENFPASKAAPFFYGGGDSTDFLLPFTPPCGQVTETLTRYDLVHHFPVQNRFDLISSCDESGTGTESELGEISSVEKDSRPKEDNYCTTKRERESKKKPQKTNHGRGKGNFGERTAEVKKKNQVKNKKNNQEGKQNILASVKKTKDTKQETAKKREKKNQVKTKGEETRKNKTEKKWTREEETEKRKEETRTKDQEKDNEKPKKNSEKEPEPEKEKNQKEMRWQIVQSRWSNNNNLSVSESLATLANGIPPSDNDERITRYQKKKGKREKRYRRVLKEEKALSLTTSPRGTHSDRCVWAITYLRMRRLIHGLPYIPSQAVDQRQFFDYDGIDFMQKCDGSRSSFALSDFAKQEINLFVKSGTPYSFWTHGYRFAFWGQANSTLLFHEQLLSELPCLSTVPKKWILYAIFSHVIIAHSYYSQILFIEVGLLEPRFLNEIAAHIAQFWYCKKINLEGTLSKINLDLCDAIGESLIVFARSLSIMKQKVPEQHRAFFSHWSLRMLDISTVVHAFTDTLPCATKQRSFYDEENKAIRKNVQDYLGWVKLFRQGKQRNITFRFGTCVCTSSACWFEFTQAKKNIKLDRICLCGIPEGKAGFCWPGDETLHLSTSGNAATTTAATATIIKKETTTAD